jgi:hypothetical protein
MSVILLATARHVRCWYFIVQVVPMELIIGPNISIGYQTDKGSSVCLI